MEKRLYVFENSITKKFNVLEACIPNFSFLALLLTEIYR